MNAEKLEHFRVLLLAQKAAHSELIREDQAAALDAYDDGVKDTPDLAVMDVNTDLAFNMGQRESEMVAEIDEALQRIKEGTYGFCFRCGKPIDERRLEAMPTARYDAQCQAIIEREQGLDNPPTL